MPDWSYHTMFKPLLFRLVPKTARNLTFGALDLVSRLPFGKSLIGFLGHMEAPAEITKSVLGIQFYSPVGLHGRIDPEHKAKCALLQFGFGFLEFGPVTLKEIDEGEIRREDRQERIKYERIDANAGLESACQLLSKLQKNDTKCLIRVGYQGDLHELQVVMDRLLPFADLFVIDGFDEQDSETFRYIKNLYAKTPVLIAVKAPILNVQPYLAMCPDGIVLDDTIRENENGYWIGKQSKSTCVEAIHNIRQIDQSIPIIASGGITEPQDGLELLDAGADLIQLHSGFVFAGPGLCKRINEALAARVRLQQIASFQEWGWLFLMGMGVFLAGIVAMVFALSTVILTYDESFLGITKDQLQRLNPKLLLFMSHDRNTLAGVMISAGFLYMQLAYHGVRKKIHWARKAFVGAAALGFLNFFYFIGFGYFDILHFIYLTLVMPLFLLGVWYSRGMRKGDTGSNVFNHKAWRHSLTGQFCFVVMGFALLTGGIVISIIGMTHVFVPQDLVYFGMHPHDITMLNPQLIPLIAHDRAGFGGGLVSEGFMLLCLSLWGFRQGEKWVWWTLCLGGLPGFAAGIGTHFYIGYTDWFHLLPAYFLFVLYTAGLIFSFRYLHLRNTALQHPQTDFSLNYKNRH